MMSKAKRLIGMLEYYYQLLNEYSEKIEGPGKLVKIDMLWCSLKYGASPSNYYNFDFRHASEKERKTFVTHRISERLMRTLNNPQKVDVMTNKYMFAKAYAPFYRRDFLNSGEMTVQELSTLLQKNRRIICKPVCGGQGKGIRCFTVDDDNREMVFQEIKGLPECIVEPWIEQDPEMSRLYPNAVNPLRIQTVIDHGKPKCVAATLTVGIDSEIANASSRALFALIDIDTGTVYTDACDYEYRVYKQHPKTGITFQGFTVPHWDEIKQMVLDAAMVTPELGYVGWDVAVSVDGPIIIEANNDPGYTAYQLPVLLGKHHGSLALWKPYLSKRRVNL